MSGMEFKIVLPYKVFAEIKEVEEIVAETTVGQFGVLPRRLDCVAEIVPGILMYRTNGNKKKYLAVDQGVLVKTGLNVQLSAHNVIEGPDLGKLTETIKKEFALQEEKEVELTSIMSRLQSGFIHTLEKLRRE